ncbi:para-aminobenzoate synthase, (PABA) [Lobaria immixta]|nr:para-aminobenzoate synthase, (PABA) [Lobaria immixta]
MSAMADHARPRILFIDAYDSFSNNIISLLRTELDVDVTVIKIDEPIRDFISFLKPFEAVVAGPGPGHPKNPGDVGWFNELWELKSRDLIPVLGICLGFQSLVLAFGGKVEELAEPRHGILKRIRTNGRSMFKGLHDISAVQYHSLHASIGDSPEGNVARGTDWVSFSKSRQMCPGLRPLAWNLQVDNPSMSDTPPSKNPRAVLMAVAHAGRPFFGVQFHPESVCSNANARKVISGWWMIAQSWNQSHRRQVSSPMPVPMVAEREVVRSSSPFDQKSPSTVRGLTSSRPTRSPINFEKENLDETGIASGGPIISTTDQNEKNGSYPLPRTTKELTKVQVVSQSLGTAHITVPDICETLKIQNGEVILLDSELHQRPAVGTCSILGMIEPTSLKLEYNIGTNQVRHVQNGHITAVDLQPHEGTIFSYLKSFMKQHKAEGGNSEIPFWGGLMGYVTYEACLETIDIPSSRQSKTPDLSFVFVERSIVFDHRRQRLHVQSIKANDWDWIYRTVSSLQEFRSAAQRPAFSTSFPTRLSLPNEHVYKSQIRDCQTFLRQGESYELCLTTQCTVQTPRSLSPWSLYLRLREHNSAPFAAYLRLGPLTLLSSSPERFLSWSRPAVLKHPKASKPTTVHGLGSVAAGFHQKTSICQFRPIKGTVSRKPKDPTAQPVDLAQATAILSTDKERAENLMIVDLIRHDLHGVVGSGNVHVRKLMVVEAYATLYQLVTVIEGTLHINDDEDEDGDDDGQKDEDPLVGLPQKRLPHHFDSNHHHHHHSNNNSNNSNNNKTGIDVLAASLPPGSMTGAPKRRSCALLQKLEHGRNRGVYSGVVGYLDAGGGGDFSIVIRSAFRWDPDSESSSTSSSLPTSTTATSPPSRDQDKSSAPHASSEGRKHEHDGQSSTGWQGGERGDDGRAVELAAQPWVIGAGGAVTCLSTEDGEWEEMRAKMSSTMGVFGGTGWEQ